MTASKRLGFPDAHSMRMQRSLGTPQCDGINLAGRDDNVVYAIDTATGGVARIPVGREPHGLTVWPQPGRYSLSHTGNVR